MNISKRTMILFFAALALIAGAWLSFKADRQEPEEEPEEEQTEAEEVQTETILDNEPIQKESSDSNAATE